MQLHAEWADSVWSDIDENRLSQLAKVDACNDVFEKLQEQSWMFLRWIL